MSNRAIILVSLLVNLGLAAWAFHLHSRRNVNLDVQTERPAAVDNRIEPGTLPRPKTTVATSEQDAPFSWAQVESADYKDYIARLRTFGCPEQTIRDIITADVNKLYAPKYRVLMPGGGGVREYWKVQPSYYSKAERERQDNLRALEKEKSALLVALLGVDPIKQKQKENGFVDYYERLLSFLPDEKRTVARDIHDQYERQLQKFYVGVFQDDEERKQMRAIREQRLAALAQVLTPEELRRYDMSTSQTGTQLRYDLDGFKPTQDEFEKIFAFRKAREEALEPIYDGNDTAAQEKRRAVQAEIDTQVKDLLGETRYAEYKRAQDYGYKELVRVLNRYELPEELAAKAYEVKTDLEGKAKQLRENSSMSSDQKKEAAKALRAQADEFFNQQLGEKAYKSYQRQGGYWLNNISR